MRYLLVLLLLASPLSAQSVKLPIEVKGAVGAFIQVPAETQDPYVSWLSLDAGLNMFPTNLLKDTKTAVVTSVKAGRYRVTCVSAKGDKPSEFAYTTVIVGDAPPVPPIPPGPNPPDPPIPPGPVPIPASGFRVMIVYETAMKLPPMQQSIIDGKVMRDYLEAKCAAEADGTKGYRIWDKDTIATGAPKLWQDVFARPRTSIPWIIVSNGMAGYEGPLPANTTDTIALLEKFK